MSESVRVRCPACRREHLYTAPSYPCACGAPVVPPLDHRATATAVTHAVWEEDWITVRCGACGRRGEWPHPELGCPCGTVLRVPVARDAEAGDADVGDTDAGDTGARDTAAGDAAVTGTEVTGAEVRDAGATGAGLTDVGLPGPTGAGLPDVGTGSAPAPERPDRHRPRFQPVTIRTARDAVTAAAIYLRWLGYKDIRRADQRPPSGIGIAARGLLAQVDPTVRPASVRDVECLWLTAMTESAGCVYFSLAGYAGDARARADDLGVPLFVLDLTGTPQPVNGVADEMDAAGA
ncbi:hypothetical protein ABZT17_36065 [Streptomyces sp. NPDC005648]|uniref:hypothetical protein n=1 Tax=Streptomyces sp. NPDC005648 TaxID=3157044 RepID=UPI0033B02F82